MVMVRVAQLAKFFPEGAERTLLVRQGIGDFGIAPDGRDRMETMRCLAPHLPLEPAVSVADAPYRPRHRPLVHETERGPDVVSAPQVVDDPRLTLQLVVRQNDVPLPPVAAGYPLGQGERFEKFAESIDQFAGERQVMVPAKQLLQVTEAPLLKQMSFSPQLDRQTGQVPLGDPRQFAGDSSRRLASRSVAKDFGHRCRAARVAKDLQRVQPAGQCEQRPQIEEGGFRDVPRGGAFRR